MGNGKKGSFSLNPKLQQVTNSGGNPSFWTTIKKVARTGTRLLGDIGVQAIDLITPDPGSTGGGSNVGFTLGGSRAAASEAYAQKKYEQDHYAKSKQMVEQGKTYFTLAKYFDDTAKYIKPKKK